MLFAIEKNLSYNIYDKSKYTVEANKVWCDSYGKFIYSIHLVFFKDIKTLNIVKICFVITLVWK